MVRNGALKPDIRSPHSLSGWNVLRKALIEEEKKMFLDKPKELFFRTHLANTANSEAMQVYDTCLSYPLPLL